MPNGYHGKILHVFLSSGVIEVEKPDDAFYRKYMGGSAFGAYYLLKYTSPNIDPLSVENTLVVSASVITGAPIQGLSRVTVVAKSPLTGCIGDSQCGGFFPAELKFSGYDAIVFHGRAEQPVYLYIHNGIAELRPAAHLWGKPVDEVEEEIWSELGDRKIQILQTGIAGENGVRFSALIHKSSRANGRTGMGAVAGSKNLKAIAVRGSQKPTLADRSEVIRISRWGSDAFPDSNVYGLGLLGTAGVIRSQNASGGLPTHNWQSGIFEGAKDIDGQKFAETLLKERETCYSCSVRCKRVAEKNEGPIQINPRFGGPEYETLAMFGAMCGINDLSAIAYANELCNKYGLDTISCGGTISWAMDCFERGLITIEDTGGLELHFGNAEALIAMVEMIAHRKGFGNLLAEGSARAAEKIGKGSEFLLSTVKKQEMPAHMPQVKRSLGLIYAVNPFGPDHESSSHDPTYAAYPQRMAELGLTSPQPSSIMNKEKVEFAYRTQLLFSCLDTLNVCTFVFGPAFQLFGPGQLVEAVRSITGWDVSIEELLEVGERRLNMLRSFNALAGITSSEDTLPKKLSKVLIGGSSQGMHVPEEEIEEAKRHYYAMAGWDQITGIPSREKLNCLGLEWVSEK